MSSMQSDTSRHFLDVIVRGLRDEPAQARSLPPSGGSTVEMDNGARFPVQDVFCHDKALHNDLLAAYQNGDARRLEKLWGQASPLVSK